MKRCFTCGNSQGDEAAFCSFCGAKLVSAEKPEEPCLLSNIGGLEDSKSNADQPNATEKVDPECKVDDPPAFFFSTRQSPDRPLRGAASSAKGDYALHSNERRPEIDHISFPDRNTKKSDPEQNLCGETKSALPSVPLWCSRKYDDLPTDLTNITLDDLDGKNDNSPENIAKKIMSPYK